MDIQREIDKIVEEFRNRYKKEWFDLVDGESLGIIGKVIESKGEKVFIVGEVEKGIGEIYQIIVRSQVYWYEVLQRQKGVYMYKSLAEGLRSVIRNSSEGDIKSVKLLSDLMLGKLNKIDDGEVEDIFDVGNEELKRELEGRNKI